MRTNWFFPIVLILGLLLAACGPTSAPEKVVPTSTPETPPPAAVIAAQEELSRSAGTPVEQIELVSYEHTEWPDSCLGLAKPDEQCLQVITPGWRIVLSVDGEQHVFRTDEDGTVIRREI
ncbi:MAG: hypothetical protein JXA37_00900 [Chloroflexia bacterium]|nr:hypothetical protein [Chloroflexia bacterium]